MKFRIEQLGSYSRNDFSCGEAALNRYFREQVTQDIKRHITNCFIALQGDVIAGFYTIASASIPVTDLPEDITRKLPRYPTLPAIRIGRLAVDGQFQKQGVGGLLIVDAVQRALRADAANFTLLVDAKNDGAVAFYQHHGFMSLASQPRTLFLPLATAAKALV